MKIICIGRNYTKHIEELANEKPENPVIFMKPDSAVLLKKNPFIIPPFSQDIHYEVEILVKINRLGKFIDEKFAHKYYEEIGLGIDFTARDVQSKMKEKGLPWEKAKAFDQSAVVGEYVSAGDLDIENLDFELHINGELAQQGNTSQMIYSVADMIEHCSQYFTLKIGELLFTGTPKGVGSVKPGDILEGYIAGQKVLKVKVK